MDSRPAKRQRRWTISSSDDESDDVQVKGTTTTRPKHPLERTAAAEKARSGGTRRLGSNANGNARSNSKALSSSSRSNPNGNHFSNNTSRVSQTSNNSRTGRAAASFSSSPEKNKNRKTKSGSDRSLTTTTSTSSLHSYFRPATQEQRWSSKRFETEREQRPLGSLVEEVGEGIDDDDDDDFIEDDYDSYDEIFTQHIINGKVDGEQDSGTRPGSSENQRRPLFTTAAAQQPGYHSKPVFNSTKRFVLPPSPVLEKNTSRATQVPENKDVDDDYDSRPWAQRYAPLTLEELAVHKRKVTDVGNWLKDVFTGKNKQRLLVLRGPAGSGKTTTVSLLSKSTGFDVVEWKNPSATESTGRDDASVGAQFEEFLGRSDKFGSLDLDEADEPAGSTGIIHGVPSSQRRILLIEEFPTVLSRNSLGLAAFRSSLLRYLAATAPSLSKSSQSGRAGTQTSPPIVIIVSETLLTSASSIADNFTVHRLLGSEIYNHPGTTIIDFNSVAPTFMCKALQLILEKEARRSKRTKVPGPAVLERISEIGDIRSAISSLEFLCLKDDKTGQWGASLAARPKRTSRDSVALTSMEKESLEMITQREASLGIFHAVGKIMYNKREDASLVPEGVEILPPPPDYLRHCCNRPKVSRVSVNELVDELGTDIQTFICALHENYVPSCEGPSFTDSLDDCIATLSDSDILCADRKGAKASRSGIGIGATCFSAGVDTLRQEEISFQVATRGLLFFLPYPVNRRLSSVDRQGRARDAFKMFFPSSLRLWGDSERMEGLVDIWTKRLLDPFSRQNMGLTGGSDSTHKPSGVRSWRNVGVGEAAFTTNKENLNDAPTMPVTMISRDDMLLYQLPFMTKISCREVGKELDEVTGFHGIRPPSDVTYEDDDLGTLRDHPTGSLQFPLPLRSRSQVGSQESSQVFGPRLPPSVEEEEEKLVLSDDDIKDD